MSRLTVQPVAATATSTAVALLVVAVVLAGCASHAPLRTQVSDWAGTSGIVSLDQQVLDDLSAITKGRAQSSAGAIKTLCDVLNDDAGAAYDELPTPDQQLTNEMNNAFVLLDKGATDCDSGESSGNRSLVDKSFDEMSRGEGELQQAVRLMATFGVR